MVNGDWVSDPCEYILHNVEFDGSFQILGRPELFRVYEMEEFGIFCVKLSPRHQVTKPIK